MEKLKTLYDITFDIEYYKDYIDIILDIFDNDNLNYDLTDKNILNIIGLYYRFKIKNYDEMKKYYLMAIKFNCKYSSFYLHPSYEKEILHYLLRQINSMVAIEIVKRLEENNFLGVKIFKELTEYCFNPQRLLKLCNIYNVELNDYMDFI